MGERDEGDRCESGTCVDGHLSYHCVCDVRWTGDDCETGKEGEKGKRVESGRAG